MSNPANERKNATPIYRTACLAQSTKPKPNVPLEKTIGHAKTEVVPSLLVFNARGADLQSDKLILNGVSLNTIVFADRPVRAAGDKLTRHIIDDWAKGAGNFAKDPPKATVSAFTKDGSGVKDVVVVLKSPKLDGDHLTFDVEVLEDDLKGADGAAAVFIDIIGRSLTPLSATITRAAVTPSNFIDDTSGCPNSPMVH